MKKPNTSKITICAFIVLIACALSSFKLVSAKRAAPNQSTENHQLNKPGQVTLTYYGDTADLVYGIYGTGTFGAPGQFITQVIRYSDNMVFTAVGSTLVVNGQYHANFDVYNSGGLKIDHYSGQIVE